MNRFLIFILLFLPLQFIAVQAQNTVSSDTVKLSLAEAHAFAVKNNLNNQISWMRVDAARGQVREVKSIGLPQVKASANYNFNAILPSSLVPADAFGFPPILPLANGDTLFIAQTPSEEKPEFMKLKFGTKNNIGFGLEATQLFFDGAYTLGLEAANLFIDQAKLSAEQNEYELKATITDAYFGALLLQENIDLLNKNVQVLSRVLNETSEFVKAGFAEQIEVDRLTLSKANLQTQVLQLERSYQIALDALRFTIGMDATQPVYLTEKLSNYLANAEQQIAVDFNALYAESLSKRKEMPLLQIQNTFRDLDIKQIKAKYLPSVVGFASGNLSYQGDNLNLFKSERWLPSSVLGLQASVPIFDGFQKKAQIQQRVILQKQAFKQEELFKRGVWLQIKQAQTKYLSAYESLNSQRDNIKLAEKIYNVTLEKYKAGIGSSLEIINAEAKLYETQGLYIKALYDLVAAKAALDKAVGR